MTQMPRHACLWAKWSKPPSPSAYHPVACHLIDVASCFSAMWPALGTRLQEWICSRLALQPAAARRTLSYWIGLHDIGKISPAFQMLVPEARQQVTDAGYRYPSRRPVSSLPHSLISQVELSDWLEAPHPWRRAVAPGATTGPHFHKSRSLY